MKQLQNIFGQRIYHIPGCTVHILTSLFTYRTYVCFVYLTIDTHKMQEIYPFLGRKLRHFSHIHHKYTDLCEQ